MTNFVYETHRMDKPHLPFIYHRNFVVTQRHSLPNWHENIEILYCTGGSGYVQCGAEIHTFHRGDIFVVNANTLHSICSEDSVAYRCLIVDNSFFKSNGISIEDLYFQNSIRDPNLASAFESIHTAFVSYDTSAICAAADIRYAVLGLIRALCKAYIIHKPNSSAVNDRIKNAVIYIRKNLSRPISLDDIAGHVGISKFHLSREFKASTGKTIIQTVNLMRCTEAKKLIEGGMGVSAAAATCGYENLSYFTRTFKTYFGKLPSALSPSADA